MVKGAKALELWCSRHTAGYPGVSVTNMASSWRDGMAFCALIHRFRPDLIDFDQLDRKNVRGNCTLAFTLAERHLGIPSLLDPDDMEACAVPDKLSILTYVSEFYHKLSKMQPRGDPSLLLGVDEKSKSAVVPRPVAAKRVVRRQHSTDSAGVETAPSRTPSENSSTPEESDEGRHSGSSSDCGGHSPTPKGKADQKSDEEEVKVVLRRKRERSLASRRLVRSMFAETTGGISSLVNDVGREGSTSPEIERENPFREVMMKFASMEQRAKKEEEERRRRADAAGGEDKATETVAARCDSKATQTFRSVLNTQLSCPARTNARSRSSHARGQQHRGSQQQQQQGLSYTATPRPYQQGQINRSLSMGQAMHQVAEEKQMSSSQQQVSLQQQQQQQQKEDDFLMTQSFCGVLPTAFSSINLSGGGMDNSQQQQQQQQQQPQKQQQQPVAKRGPRSSSSHARTPSIHKIAPGDLSSIQMYQQQQQSFPSSMSASFHSQQQPAYYSQRPLIWHSSPYSSSPSLHLPQQQQQQQRPSRYFSYAPTGYQGTTLRHAQQQQQQRRPLSVYSRPTTLHIEGQSSLV